MCLCLLLTVRSDYSWVMCIPEHPFRKEYIRGCGLEFLCISWIHWRPKQHFIYLAKYTWASQVAQTVKNPPAMPETWFWSLGQEDPLEKGMVTHSSILAWRIPWTEEPSGLQSMGLQRVGHDWSDLAMADDVWSFRMPSKRLVWWGICLDVLPSL